MTYAAQTTVSVEKSRLEIERTLQRYGASQFIYGWDQEMAVVGFVYGEDEERRQVRFKLAVPAMHQFLRTSNGRSRSRAAAEKAWEQAQRQRWRALLLAIKAKLEAIEAGIATFESEFLAYVVLPSGETVGEWISPQLHEAYRELAMPGPLRLALPAGGDA